MTSNDATLYALSEQERDRHIERLVSELPVLRTKLGLSQDDLAGILDISRQTYSYMETKRRKMSWSVYLALILLFDNNIQTHDYLRKNDIFPEIVFQNGRIDSSDSVLTSFSKLSEEDIRSCLDEKAIHAIETVIMVEYARCNNMSSEAVIKAFEGRRAFQTSDNTAKAKRALETIKAEVEEG